jgi:hypothetical protein
VINTDFHICGFVTNGSSLIATVWKNGVATTLSTGSNNATAYSFFAAGSDVYVAGYELNASVFVAKLWKNGVATTLSNLGAFSDATSVFVSGNNVYVAGQERNNSILWKNGVVAALTDGLLTSKGYGMFVK